MLRYGRLTYPPEDPEFRCDILRGARTCHRSLILSCSGAYLLSGRSSWRSRTTVGRCTSRTTATADAGARPLLRHHAFAKPLSAQYRTDPWCLESIYV